MTTLFGSCHAFLRTLGFSVPVDHYGPLPSYVSAADAQPRRLDIPPFTLRLRGSLMLYGVVDTTDVPTSEAARIAQRYVIKLEPMLSIKNTLPFPITVSMYLRNTVESHQSHDLAAGSGSVPGATAPGGVSSAAHDGSAYGTAAESGRHLGYAFGNPQAELLAELESRKRQKQEAQQRLSRGTAAQLVANNYVEATIPSHQSWVREGELQLKGTPALLCP